MDVFFVLPAQKWSGNRTPPGGLTRTSPPAEGWKAWLFDELWWSKRRRKRQQRGTSAPRTSRSELLDPAARCTPGPRSDAAAWTVAHWSSPTKKLTSDPPKHSQLLRTSQTLSLFTDLPEGFLFFFKLPDFLNDHGNKVNPNICIHYTCRFPSKKLIYLNMYPRLYNLFWHFVFRRVKKPHTHTKSCKVALCFWGNHRFYVGE